MGWWTWSWGGRLAAGDESGGRGEGGPVFHDFLVREHFVKGVEVALAGFAEVEPGRGDDGGLG